MRTSPLKQKKVVIIKCEYCGDEYPLESYAVGKRKHHFCSQRCKGHWSYENLLKGKFDQTGTEPQNKRFKTAEERTKWWSDHLRTSDKGKVNALIKSGIYQALKFNRSSCGRKRKWEIAVGYTSEELRTHLESLFTEGMAWINYSRNGWHVDHIIPISEFTYDSIDDDGFRDCWSLDNLRPLWATENRKKNRYLRGE